MTYLGWHQLPFDPYSTRSGRTGPLLIKTPDDVDCGFFFVRFLFWHLMDLVSSWPLAGCWMPSAGSVGILCADVLMMPRGMGMLRMRIFPSSQFQTLLLLFFTVFMGFFRDPWGGCLGFLRIWVPSGAMMLRNIRNVPPRCLEILNSLWILSLDFMAGISWDSMGFNGIFQDLVVQEPFSRILPDFSRILEGFFGILPHSRGILVLFRKDSSGFSLIQEKITEIQ